MLASIWRMDDRTAIVRCHAPVRRFIHCGNAATSIFTELILPVLDWSQNQRMVIGHSRPILTLDDVRERRIHTLPIGTDRHCRLAKTDRFF